MTTNYTDLLSDVIEKTQKTGADKVDAVIVSGRSRAISWRSGALEDVDGSESLDLGLRVLIGQKQAFTSSSDLGARAVNALIERTVDMAKSAPEDPYCGLLDQELLGSHDIAALELCDTTDIPMSDLTALAAEAEDAALGVAGVKTSDGAQASAGQQEIALATSDMAPRHYRSSNFSVSVSAIAERGGLMERDYDFTSKRFWADMESAATIGKTAGEQAVARLNPEKLASGQMPVVYAPRVANSLLGHLIGAITGAAIARQSSFLMNSLGEAIFPSAITILDDPLITRGLKSRPFDGEGHAGGKTMIIDQGVLTGWLHNRASAAQLEQAPTGHASRGIGSPPGIGTSNLYMAAGSDSPAALMADIKDGFYITELIGMGVNGVTGDYSRGAAGFRIENGELTTPVSEVTVAGNLKEMFKALTAANDLDFRYGINTPTLRVDGMTIAGS